MKVKIVEVIRTDSTEGRGTPECPVHIMRRYWTMDGELISEEVYRGDCVKTKLKSPIVPTHPHKPDQHQ